MPGSVSGIGAVIPWGVAAAIEHDGRHVIAGADAKAGEPIVVDWQATAWEGYDFGKVDG